MRTPVSRLTTRFVVSLVLVITSPGLAVAQSRFDSWTTENGLPQNSVYDILQTRDGFLWIATGGGLVRFDGVRFAVFDRSTPGIESQRISALHEDRHGTLWAASGEGLLIRYRDGRFTTYASKDLTRNAGAVRIEEDDDGILWVTGVASIGRFDGERLTYGGPDQLSRGVAAPPDLRYLYLDTWWRQDSAGLHALVNGRVQTHPLRGDWVVTGVNTDRRGNLWIRTAGAGLVKAADGRLERYTTREGLPGNDLEGIFHEGVRGSIWFWDGRTHRLYRINDDQHELIDLWGPRAFYVDREGSTWIGTLAHGLHRLREPTATVYTERDGLPLDRIYSILEDTNGAKWIGTWDVGLSRYAGGRFTSYGSAEGLPSRRITCIYEDKAGRLWVGTQHGLTYFENGRFRRYEQGIEFLSGSVWAIHQDRGGTFWFATDAGLVKAADHRFTRYTTTDGVSHNRITALFEDGSGALWIGTFQGVTRLRDGAFTVFDERAGFIGNEVRAFHEDPDGRLWIGTYDGGLYRLSDEHLTRYSRNEGLHDNGVFQILEDDDGYLWMGSNTGISRVSRRELNELADGHRRSITPVVFGTKDGLPTVEVNGGRQPSGWRTADGRLWFPTMGGLAVIDPAIIRIDVPPPRSVIEEVRVAGKPVDPAQELRVPSRTAVFEIRYTAPTFVRPEQVRFRYRLAGLTADWVEAGDQRSLSFYGVRPGHYTFALTAANSAGVWSTDGPTLEIVVLPPLWGTWWFRVAAIAVVAIALFAAHTGRVRRLRREQAKRSVYLQEMIDAQERERTRISNEVHDSLGYDLSVMKQHAREGLERWSGDGGPRQQFQQILSVAGRLEAEMKAVAYALRPYHLDKVGLTQSIRELVAEVSRASSLEVGAQLADIDGLFPKEAETHIYRIVQESLNNVVKHSRARRATVTVTRGAHAAEIRIDDDGEGLSEGAAGEEILGFGLIGMRARAQLVGGDVRIASNQWRGTSIVVLLEIGRSTDDVQ